jgi:hypothetical protein
LAIPVFTLAQPSRMFNWKEAASSIVVAEARVGGQFPQYEECMRPLVLCMDTAPYWLDATIVSTVHGAPVPAKLTASSADHYGGERFKTGNGTFLIPLKRVGDDFRIPRNAGAMLVESKSGVLYLPIAGSYVLNWLPCTINTLRDEIQESDFHEDGVTALESFDGAERSPTLFRPTRKGTMPRYAISVPRLAEHLSKIASEGGSLTCEPASK